MFQRVVDVKVLVGLNLSLEDGRVNDGFRNRLFLDLAPSIYCILSGYAEAEPVPEALKLISFRQLPGGHAFHEAFLGRVVFSIKRCLDQRLKCLLRAGNFWVILK